MSEAMGLAERTNQYGGLVMATVWNQGILAVEASEQAQAANGVKAADAAEAPEPSSLALLAAGGVALAAWRRRRSVIGPTGSSTHPWG